jgi:small nuclear ribonucleoprotein (snRNP)-like protein
MEIEQDTSTLDLLIGFNVNLYVGEEIFKGKLIDVEPDHIILENENNNIFYYSTDHIQAIEKDTKEFPGQEATAEYLQTQSLIDLLHSLKNSWVTILCLNKQKFNGVLSQVDKSFATLISGEERIFIKLSYISNVFKGILKENNIENEAKNQDQYQAKNQDQNEEKKKEEHIEIGFNEKADHETASVLKTDLLDESSIKVVASASDKDLKVWSQSIKDIKEKLNFDITQKINTKMKKSIEDEFQLINRENESKKLNVKSRENERKPTNEVKAPKKQEPVIMGKDVVHPNSSKSPSKVGQYIPQAKNEEVKRKEDSISTSRFLGEPANLREIERTVFSGWPDPRD